MPGLVDFVGYQGDLFERTLTPKVDGVLYPLDGVGIRMQIRRWYDVAPPIIAISLGDGIVVNVDGKIVIDITAVQMAELPLSTGDGFVYDLELVPDGDEDRAFKLIAGHFTVLPEATHDDGP